MTDLYSTYMMLSALTSINRSNRSTALKGSTAANTSSSGVFRNVYRSAQESESAKKISAGTSMDALFEEASQKYGVNVNLLKAIAKAESGFDASVTSSAGAMGVMQLMPGTAKSLGVTNAYDARQNIMGGAKYISGLLDKYDGNTRLALAAYNAGSGNVAKYGGVPPFKETQNYVKKVLSYAGQTITTGKSYGYNSVQSNIDNAGLNGAGTNGIAAADQDRPSEIETLLSLITIMRAQMEMRFGTMLADNSSNNNDGLFRL